MIDYVVKLTKDATKVSPVDHERLRGAGFDDRAILQITLDRVLVQLHQPRRRCAGRRPRLNELRTSQSIGLGSSWFSSTTSKT